MSRLSRPALRLPRAVMSGQEVAVGMYEERCAPTTRRVRSMVPTRTTLEMTFSVAASGGAQSVFVLLTLNWDLGLPQRATPSSVTTR